MVPSSSPTKKVRTVSPILNFAQAIRHKADVRCGGQIGIMMADLMDGMYASVRSGRPVKLRPKRT